MNENNDMSRELPPLPGAATPWRKGAAAPCRDAAILIWERVGWSKGIPVEVVGFGRGSAEGSGLEKPARIPHKSPNENGCSE